MSHRSYKPNLSSLKLMRIDGCQNLSSISFEGISQLLSLKRLELRRCKKLFSSDVMPDAIHEDLSASNWKAFPCLESLSIRSCGISGKWLSLLLRHVPHLEELHLKEEYSRSNRILTWEDSSSGNQGDALTGLAQDGLVHIPLSLVSSLKKITIDCCTRLILNLSEEGFSVFTSLQELKILKCPKLLSSLVHEDGNNNQANGRCLLPTSLEECEISERPSYPSDLTNFKTLQPCFPSDVTSLKRLNLWVCAALESVQLRSCTALEELKIVACASFNALEGLQSLLSLRHLEVSECPGIGLRPWLETFSRQDNGLCSRLETLEIDDPSVLATSVCKCLTSLQRLNLQNLVLTEVQGRALLLLKSLQELEFRHCDLLVDLPAGLHLLPSLKRLKIKGFPGGHISGLPERGLPLSLEELEIEFCSKELADQCRLLATSKLDVKIGYCFLN